MHLDLDKSYWKRGTSPWERDVNAVDDVLRQSTGLSRITRRHERYFVEFIIRQELFPQAAVAVAMQFGPQNDSKLLR